MSPRKSGQTLAFTIIEMLVSITIIMLLVGIVYAGLAPVREKGREAYCLNNLRQIGHAIQMYRQDHEGREPPGALNMYQLGLPPHGALDRGYIRAQAVWKCPSEYWPPPTSGPPDITPVSYLWLFQPDEDLMPGLPPFSKIVAARGDDTPLLADPHHGQLFRGAMGKPFKVLVLRLSGQVERRMVPFHAPSDEW